MKPVENRRPAPRGGCLALVAFLIVEMIVGFGIGYLVASNLWAFLEGIGWGSEASGLTAIFTAMAAAFIPVYWIDRQCERMTGESALNQLPFIP